MDVGANHCARRRCHASSLGTIPHALFVSEQAVDEEDDLIGVRQACVHSRSSVQGTVKMCVSPPISWAASDVRVRLEVLALPLIYAYSKYCTVQSARPEFTHVI